MISFKVDHDLFYATLSITHCFVNINGLRASFLQDYEVQSSNPSEFSNRIWHFGHNPFYFFLSLKDQYSFFGGGEISFTWITNSKSVLFCCRFLVLFFFKADHVQCSLPFPSLDEGPDIPITQMLLIAPLITTIILPLKRAIRISVQRSSWRWRSFISLQMLTLNLILGFQFVCSCHVTIRMQHKTIYKSWFKQILKNMRICAAGEILCTGKFQFPASLSNAKSPLYFHDSTNPLFVLVGTEWYWCCWQIW